MKTIGLAWFGCAGILLVSTLGACGSSPSPLGNDGGASSSGGGSGGGGSSSSGGGGSSSSGVSGSSSGASSGGSSSGVSSGGSSSGVSSGGGSSSGTTTGGYGDLTFEQCADASAFCGGSTGQFQFYAQFDQGPDDQGCQVTTTGACSVYVCSTSTTPVGVDAGTLAIWGGSIPAGTAIAPEAGTVGQYTFSSGEELFTASQTLKVESTGSVVPLFGPVAVVAPPVGTLLSPAAVGGQYSIPTSADLPVAWSGGQSGAQLIVEGAGTGGGADSYFLCTWDAATGSGTIPASVLAGFAGQPGGFFVYGQMTSTSIAAGGYALSVSALQYGGGNASFE